MLSPFQGNDFSQGDSLGAYTKKTAQSPVGVTALSFS